MLTFAADRRGFTLIEMAMVLMTIGLLIGGLLVGEDLIKAAALRAQMTQIERLNTAIITFQGKYDCLPGDCANATTFFAANGQPAQVTNGNGDGMIGAGDPSNYMAISWTFGSTEWKSVFDHLGAANLWNLPQYDETNIGNARAGFGYPLCAYAPDGAYVGDLPASSPGALDCGVIVFWANGAHYFRLGAAPGPDDTGGPNYLAFYGGITPAIASLLDTKFDDGLPLGGSIQIGPQPAYQINPDNGSDNIQLGPFFCANAVGTSYNTGLTNRDCSMRIKAAF